MLCALLAHDDNTDARQLLFTFLTRNIGAHISSNGIALTGLTMDEMTPESILTYRGTVYPWHCDHMGHMNVMWYVGKFDEATWQLFGSIGLSPKRLRTDGIGMVAVEQRIEYKRELLAGDLLTIRSSVQEVREKALLLLHEMTNQETQELAARTVLTGVCIDMATRKARPLPSDVRERLVSMSTVKADE
ncbi:MAG TPA: thioesterase family protein [Bryobacteraceae bacterium]